MNLKTIVVYLCLSGGVAVSSAADIVIGSSKVTSFLNGVTANSNETIPSNVTLPVATTVTPVGKPDVLIVPNNNVNGTSVNPTNTTAVTAAPVGKPDVLVVPNNVTATNTTAGTNSSDPMVKSEVLVVGNTTTATPGNVTTTVTNTTPTPIVEVLVVPSNATNATITNTTAATIDPPTPVEVAVATSTSVPCIEVSVERDATFCISTGPICSGSDAAPAGIHCPLKGDLAKADCHKRLKSYASGTTSCVAPSDAKCQKIYTGAWGCVWEDAEPLVVTKKATSSGVGAAEVKKLPCTGVKGYASV